MRRMDGNTGWRVCITLLAALVMLLGGIGGAGVVVEDVVAAGPDWCNTSVQTADAAVTSGKGLFYGYAIGGLDGSNAVTVTVYDNSAGSGTKLAPTMTFAGDGGPQFLDFDPPTPYYTGIYLDVTTSGTVQCGVRFRPTP